MPCIALGHGVVRGEAVFLEQRIEHRLGDEMLRQHFHDVGIGDAVVQVIAQLCGELLERFSHACCPGCRGSR